MLKNNTYKVIFILVLVLTFSVVFGDSNKKDPVLLSLGEEQFNKLGLNKLNSTEKNNLFKFMQPVGNYSLLENSAALYLESQGWEPMHVVGIYEDGHDLNNVALCNYNLLLIDTFTERELLDPGVYWIKRSSFRMDVILNNGTVESYSYDVVEQ